VAAALQLSNVHVAKCPSLAIIWRRKSLVAATPTRRHPTPDPAETTQSEFVKISNEEAPLPLTRVVISEEAVNPVFKTPVVETPFLTPQLHPIHDAFRMRDLRAKNEDDREEFVGKGLICNIMCVVCPTTGTT
jgi:hypothetical protein